MSDEPESNNAGTSAMDWSTNAESSEDDDFDESDEVVGEMDVFVSKGHADSLYLLQYPLRPSDQSVSLGMERGREITCEFKPKQEKLQIKLPLDASSTSYDKSRGEQIAVNCGASSSSASTSSKTKAPPFERMMDYQYLVSSNASGFHNNCYAVGYLQNGQLHLTPFKNVLQMRPSFGYLDAADSSPSSKTTGSRGAQAEATAGDSSQDDSETEAGPSGTAQLQTVRVKFKEESEWLRKRREASYQYQQKIKDEEPWVPLKFVPEKDGEILPQKALLLGNARWTSPLQQPIDVTTKDAGESSSQSSAAAFEIEATQLLRLLAPRAEEQKITSPRHIAPSTVVSFNQLKSLPLPDQVRTLLTNVKVLRFSQLLSLLPPKSDVPSVLKHLQSYAQLVKGCWVVKSDILHPKGSFSPRTGASADLLCRARDYAMYKFTQTSVLTKRDIAHAVKIPSEDIDDILNQLARFKVQSGWQFMYPPDTEFMQNYLEIAQQQTAKWEAKFKDLSQHLTLNRQRHLSSSGSVAGGASPASRRRRTDSGRNSMTDAAGVASDHETGLMSPPPAFIGGGSRNRRRSSSGTGSKSNNRVRTASSSSTVAGTSQPRTFNNGVADGGQSPSSLSKYDPAAMAELKKSLYDAFSTKPILSLARLQLLLKVKVSESSKDHPLAKCMDERMIEDCAMQLGVAKFEKSYGEKAERTYYAFTDGSWPELRQCLIKFLHDKSQGKKEKASFRFNAFKQACAATLASDDMLPSDAEMKQLISEYCVLKQGGYYVLQDS